MALAAVNLQLGDLPAAKEHVLKVVEAAPAHYRGAASAGPHSRRARRTRGRTCRFPCRLDLSPPSPDPAATPVHLALHNLEQLAYLEQLHGLPPGTLLPISAAQREETRRQFNEILDKAGSVRPVSSSAATGAARWPSRRA